MSGSNEKRSHRKVASSVCPAVSYPWCWSFALVKKIATTFSQLTADSKEKYFQKLNTRNIFNFNTSGSFLKMKDGNSWMYWKRESAVFFKTESLVSSFVLFLCIVPFARERQRHSGLVQVYKNVLFLQYWKESLVLCCSFIHIPQILVFSYV